MKVTWKIWSSLILVSIVFLVSEKTVAQELKVLATPAPVSLKNSDDSENQTIEPSAVEPIGGGKFLLVADDKDDGNGNSLKIIETSTGKVLKTLTKIQSSDKNPKWEALAKDEQENYYVIGSHNNADAQKLARRSLMFRFRLNNEMEQDAAKIEIDAASVRELDVKESLTALQLYSTVPANNKVKIEGLAVRKTVCGQELIIGFREPFDITKADTVKVYSAIIPNDAFESKAIIKLSLKPLFQLNAEKTADKTPFQLSSIEYVQDLKGFLVLTSTETKDASNKAVSHGNALWFVSDEMIETARPTNFSESYKTAPTQKVLKFQPSMKAEGICLLSKRNQKTFRFALVFDNDAEETKIGGKMQFIELSTAPN